MNPNEIAKLLSVGEGKSLSDIDPRVSHLVTLVQAMGDVAPDKDTPVREVMARLGDNWSALLLKVLAGGEYRHATLKRIISAIAAEGDISQRMLTLRLRALERDGFVTRREEPCVPPRVYYSLTDLGKSLEAQLTMLIHWIESHDAQIMAARAAFNDKEQ